MNEEKVILNTIDPFERVLANILYEHSNKQREKGSPDMPYKNIVSSERFGMPGWVNAVSNVEENVCRVEAYVRDGFASQTTAGVRNALLDMATYACIANVLFTGMIRED